MAAGREFDARSSASGESVIAVIFEVEPTADSTQLYFELAAALKSDLEAIDGFISVERFQSLTRSNRFLSLSFWRDEDAVRSWRCHGMHRQAQQTGRDLVFSGYRLRVALVLRDYGLHERDEAPEDSRTTLV
jgi:heme-degrading monooxygenase HmoA